MKIKRYEELQKDNEITFLEDDIKETFSGYPEVKKTTAKYILLFKEIKEEDTLLTIYNFISTQELKFKITTDRHGFIKIILG